MNKANYLIECVPNISEGRDLSKINRIIQEIEKEKIEVLEVDSGYDANRTVITLKGDVNEMTYAIRQLYHICHLEIDMREQKGEHPRIGAVDICPFIPFDPKDRADLKNRVKNIASSISKDINIPIFLYAESSIGPDKKTLPKIRAGEYEKLMTPPNVLNYPPDFGLGYKNEKFGGSVMGVRDFMIAYNVNLSTKDLKIAKKIAKAMRQIRKETGSFRNINIKPLQILGWYMEAFGCCQISTNIHNPRELSLVDVFEFTKEIAAKHNVQVTASEIVGLVPDFAFELAQNNLSKTKTASPLQDFLGLDFNGPFNWEKKTIRF